MKRNVITPRDGWKKWCEGIDFPWHTQGGVPYWNERACYEFTAAQIDQIEAAAEKAHGMCMELVGDIITRGRYEGFGFPKRLLEVIVPAIEMSWKRRDPSFYGRFDFGMKFVGGKLGIKMYEYNADTPTSLYEASVVQWLWKQALNLPDQFNSIEEKMDAFFRSHPAAHMYFVALRDAGLEDWGTIGYIAERARECGKGVSMLPVEDLGWDEASKSFIDKKNAPVGTVFKLYPTEWMFGDEYAVKMGVTSTRWIEPPWKVLLSSKAVLPLLWERFPNHPLLLPSFFEREGDKMMQGDWIKKPLFSREGANVSFVTSGVEVQAAGSHHSDFYAAYGYIGQQRFDPSKFDGMMPVIGAWIVNGEPAGMGIREDAGVTGNGSQFVPHFFR
jgi:glutathionylspermidine synthase